MTSLESIEKLRELACDINGSEIVDHMQLYPSCVFDGAWLDSWHCEFDRVLEALEREIAEKYIELPVDADGVPIHCGERMRLDNGHEGDVWLIGVFDIMMSDHTCFDWAKSRHVKPRTVEDVLNDFAKRVLNSGHQWGLDAEETTAEYADELRELLGGDGE